MKIGVSNFVKRQTKESKYSYYEGTWEDLVKLVKANFHNFKRGYKKGVILIPVDSEGFYSSLVKVTENDILKTEFLVRSEGEEPYLNTTVMNKSKQEAVYVEIVLYSAEVLAEDNNRSGEYDWEIISINASVEKEVPMSPITMMRNETHEVGGTQATYTKEEYIKAIKFWGQHANISEDKPLIIPKHLADNLDNYNIFLETEESIDDFMFNIYETYESESYASYDVIKAYLNPLTKKYVFVEE